MIPDAVMKIAFDRFHVAKHLGDAVDRVRRAEHKALVKEGNGILVLPEQNLGAGRMAPVAGSGHRAAAWSRS